VSGSLGVVRRAFIVAGKGVRRRAVPRRGDSSTWPRRSRSCSASLRRRRVVRPARTAGPWRRPRSAGGRRSTLSVLVGRHQPQRAVPMARPAKRRTWRACSAWAPRTRTAMAGALTVTLATTRRSDRPTPRPPRHPQQRLVRPAHRPQIITAQSRGPAMGRSPRRRTITTPCTGRGQTCSASVNEPADPGLTLDLRLLPPGQVPPIPTTPDGLRTATERFVARQPVVHDRPHVRRAGHRQLGGPRDVDYPRPRLG
jgi:hypothetical protein